MTGTPVPFACYAPAPGMVSLREALAILEAQTVPLVASEELLLEAALGRILARPLVSDRPVPAFDNVAVDGFAFAGATLGEGVASRFRLVEGRAAAGHPFAGRLSSGEAVRAFTGAPMPEGADTVAMTEETVVEDGWVVVPKGFKPGANRRRAGEDVAPGQELFGTGQQLSARHLGVAAELGLTRLRVFAPLKVALLSSGDELAPPGTALAPGGIYDANRPILRALLARLPVAVTDLGILRDDALATRAVLEKAGATHDLILASGGASKSEADHVVRTVAEAGDLAFWQIRMKPGRPLATGRLGRAQFIGLPGNPVAATVCFLLFARPAILRMAGGAFSTALGLPVPAGFALRKRVGRTELLRARLIRGPDGPARVERILREGSGILTSLTDADGLVEIPEEVTTIEPGEPVRFTSFAELGAGY